MIDWTIISSMSSRLKSMIKTLNLKNLIFACIKTLRQVNDLIDWNWDSNVELKLIAKILNLNDLNSLLNLRRAKSWIDWDLNRSVELNLRSKDFNLWDLIDQLAKREKNILICMLLRLFFDQLFVFFLSYRDSWCFDVLNDVQFFESIETTSWVCMI